MLATNLHSVATEAERDSNEVQTRSKREVWLTIAEVVALGSAESTVRERVRRGRYASREINGEVLVGLNSLPEKFRRRYEGGSKAPQLPRGVDYQAAAIEAGRRLDLLNRLERLSRSERTGIPGQLLRHEWAKAPEELIRRAPSLGKPPALGSLDRILRLVREAEQRGETNAALVTLGRLSPRDTEREPLMTEEMRRTAVSLYTGHKGGRRVGVQPECKSSAYEAWCETAGNLGWPLVSYTTFCRALSEAAAGAITLSRLGPREYERAHSAYLERDLSDLAPGELWVGDHHVLDLFVYDVRSGKLFRPWLTGWLDSRSRALMGWVLSRSPSTLTIKAAFGHGVLRKRRAEYARLCGLPKAVYQDNGKDYCCRDLEGGTARFGRAGLGDEDIHEIKGLYGALDIIVKHAKPFNARAKIIERYFWTVSRRFSSCCPGYCGHDPKSKPAEYLKRDIALHQEFLAGKRKESPFLSMDELRDRFERWLLKKYHLRPHKALEDRGRKFSPLDVFELFGGEVEVPREETICLHLMRRFFTKVQSNGVRIEGHWYLSDRLLEVPRGTPVQVRRHPDDAGRVYVFTANANPTFLAEAVSVPLLRGHATEEQIREANQWLSERRKHVKRQRAAMTSCIPREMVSVSESLTSGIVDPLDRVVDPPNEIRRMVPDLDRVKLRQVEPPAEAPNEVLRLRVVGGTEEEGGETPGQKKGFLPSDDWDENPNPESWTALNGGGGNP